MTKTLRRYHRRAIGLLSSLVVVLLLGADESIDPRMARLQAMPRSERQRLWENLQRFDKASRAEQERVRDLDRRIAGLSTPTQQAHYFSVLRRYNLWFAGLADAKQEELLKASPDDRMTLVSKFMAEQKTQRKAASPLLLLHIADLGAFSPVDVALIYRVWSELEPSVKASIEKAPPQQFRGRIADNGVKLQITQDSLLPAKYKEAAWVEKIEKKQQLRLLRNEPVTKAKEMIREEARRHLALNLYFLEHPPKAVSDNNLAAFMGRLPQLVRSTFDIFPPDEARRRLSNSYRLVYPEGEIPPPQKPGGAAAKGNAAPGQGASPQPVPGAPENTKAKSGASAADAPF